MNEFLVAWDKTSVIKVVDLTQACHGIFMDELGGNTNSSDLLMKELYNIIMVASGSHGKDLEVYTFASQQDCTTEDVEKWLTNSFKTAVATIREYGNNQNLFNAESYGTITKIKSGNL
jgi:hypothetical protein